MREPTRTILLEVNGTPHTVTVPVRKTLADVLREDLRLTGTHVGCEQGVCGACTVLLDGEPVRSCLLLAVQAQDHRITTVEALGTPDQLHPVQRAFWENHALQCGFCTPGILMTVVAFLRENPDPSQQQIREVLAGHLCRCTGYQHIVRAVEDAAARMRQPQG